MKLGVSVIICCYNSASRIKETLNHLSKQKISSTISWEIILVNNASTDNTKEIAFAYWSSLNFNFPLKIVDESKSGLSWAREKGIEVSQYDTILFCDDDNWLCDSYVETAYHIIHKDLMVGIAGGWCTAQIEQPVETWMIPFFGALAVGRPSEHSSFLAKKGKCVNGAGMVIRKNHYLELIKKGFRSMLDDRKQNILSSGGDTELCWVMMYAGYEVYFDQSLFFKHVIPETRLKREYLLKLTLTSLYPVIILSIYSFVFWNRRGGFTKFFRKDMASRLNALVHYSPRMIFGKYPLYSSVVFRQNLKILGMLITKFSNIKGDFDRIKKLRHKLR